MLLALTAACTTVNSSGSGVQVHTGGTLAAVILGGMLISAASQDLHDPRPFPSLSVFSGWMGTRPPPEMNPDRAVKEQDCTKPIELSGNLRCR